MKNKLTKNQEKIFKEFFSTIENIKSCYEDEILKIGKNKILNYLKTIKEEPFLQEILGWRDIKPSKVKPKDSELNKPKKFKRNLRRKKAFEYCKTIHERLKSIDGIFVGSNTDFRYKIIFNVWLFGSMAKGSENPNDLDILYDYKLLSLSREYSNYIDVQFFKFLTGGLRQISLHDFVVDNCLAEDHKIEIYPEFKLKL